MTTETDDALKVNNLERPYIPGREPIPERWTPEHVGRRLVEAFETLNRMPRPRGPKQPGGSWPGHSYDFADQRGWYDLPVSELAERDAAQNRSRQKPDSRQLAQMEAGLEWVRWLRGVDEALSRVLSLWALWKSTHQPIGAQCKARKWTLPTFYRQQAKACLWISEMLNRKGELVF